MFPCLNVEAEMESFNCTTNIWAVSASCEEHQPLINIRSWWWWCTNAWRFKQTVKLASSCTELVIITYLYKRDSLKCGVVLQITLPGSWLSRSRRTIWAKNAFCFPPPGRSNDWAASFLYIFVLLSAFLEKWHVCWKNECVVLFTTTNSF